ncbi:MAG TPA: hypothetical protein VJT31_42150 [Rugosimonospora sp.]|nr:hypothetical protein [Rugosimonospora sp.]
MWHWTIGRRLAALALVALVALLALGIVALQAVSLMKADSATRERFTAINAQLLTLDIHHGDLQVASRDSFAASTPADEQTAQQELNDGADAAGQVFTATARPPRYGWRCSSRSRWRSR